MQTWIILCLGKNFLFTAHSIVCLLVTSCMKMTTLFCAFVYCVWLMDFHSFRLKRDVRKCSIEKGKVWLTPARCAKKITHWQTLNWYWWIQFMLLTTNYSFKCFFFFVLLYRYFLWQLTNYIERRAARESSKPMPRHFHSIYFYTTHPYIN